MFNLTTMRGTLAMAAVAATAATAGESARPGSDGSGSDCSAHPNA